MPATPSPGATSARPTGGLRSLGRILVFTRELTPSYVVVVICSVLTALTALAVPFLIGRATDVVVSVTGGTPLPEAVPQVIWLAVILLGVGLLQAAVSNIGGWTGDVMSNRMRAILSIRYFEKLLAMPQRWFDEEMTGTIVSRLNRSITGVTDFAKMFANNLFTMVITTVAILVISFAHYWPLGVILVIIFPAYLWLTALTSRRWQVLEHEKNAHVDTAGGRFAEVVGQIRVVKSFVQERGELTHFAEHFDRTDTTTRAQSSHWHRMDVLRQSVLHLLFFGLHVIIFIRTATGHFSLGEMVVLIQLINMAREPVTMLSFVIDSAQRAIAGSRDYFTVMDSPLEARAALASGRVRTEDQQTQIALDRDTPAISFSDVRFGYQSGTPVLDGVSFEIRRGERVALVSESGGGKTTLVNLLLGLYDLDGGKIMINGQDVAALPMEQVRRQVGVVFQEPALFSGTVADSIAYGRPEASEEQIRQAARRAGAHDFVSAFPDGYQQVIGERGMKLSGGQKQRLAVARAMLKDAPVLVLDEATSSLDARSERQVQQGLEELMAGRSSLVIAHRLSTIADVDRIVTLADGRVDEIGTPAELATTGGVYAQLLAVQQRTRRGDRELLDPATP